MLGLFAFALARLLEEESNSGLVGNVWPSAFADGSQEGKGVEDANEPLEGNANTIGPRDEGVVGDGGV